MKKKTIISIIILATIGIVGFVLYRFIFNRVVPGGKKNGVTLLDLKRYLISWERQRLKKQYEELQDELNNVETQKNSLGVPVKWEEWLQKWIEKEVAKGNNIEKSLKIIYDYMNSVVTFDDIVQKSKQYPDVYRFAILTNPSLEAPDETLEYIATKWGYAV